MTESDEELNELLDDAIQDFKVFKNDETQPELQKKDTDTRSKDIDIASQNSASTDKLFEDVFKEIASGNPNAFNDDFLTSFLNNPELNGGLQPDLSEKLKSALDSMKDDIQSFQNGDLGDESIMKMMSELRVGEESIDDLSTSDPNDDSFFTAMKGMMRNLLSKDILYPSLKDVAVQYPEWLTNNAATTSQSDLQRYKSQFSIIKKIIEQFDAETSLDSESVKMARFQHILELMQSMQSLGQPPPELLAHLPKNVELDSNGLPKFTPQFFQNYNDFPSANNCTLM